MVGSLSWVRTNNWRVNSRYKKVRQLSRPEVTQDTLLDEINRLKKECESDKQQLENYIYTKERIANMGKAELQLKDYCKRLHGDLDNATYQDKREILEMLAIKVTATPEQIDVHGIIPLEATPTQTSDDSLSLLTTGQTSACLCFYRNICC